MAIQLTDAQIISLLSEPKALPSDYQSRLQPREPLAVQKSPMPRLVEQIVAAMQANPNADTSALERGIDQQVYALYGLTPEEIQIVEESAK